MAEAHRVGEGEGEALAAARLGEGARLAQCEALGDAGCEAACELQCVKDAEALGEPEGVAAAGEALGEAVAHCELVGLKEKGGHTVTTEPAPPEEVAQEVPGVPPAAESWGVAFRPLGTLRQYSAMRPPPPAPPL